MEVNEKTVNPTFKLQSDTNINVSEENVSVQKIRITWFTFLSSFIANLLLVSLGTFFVWSSPVIPKLKCDDPELNPLGSPVTTRQVSIIASMPFFCSTFSHNIAAKMSDKVGRKKMILFLAFGTVVNLVVLAFATNIWVYYICLFFAGFINAGSFINSSIYNVEISEDKNRGTLCCFVGLALPLGMLCGYIFGPMTSVRGITLICAIPPAITILLSYFLSESPIYLASIGKRAEAIRSLEQLRKPRDHSDIEIEFQRIKDSIIAKNNIQNVKFFDIFKSRPARKAIYLSLLICATQQMSGISIILAFMSSIFIKSGSTIPGDYMGVLIGLIKVCIYLVAAYFVDKLGRRQLLLVSSLCCAISMFSLGAYFWLKDIESPVIDHIRWFPVVCGITFIIGFGLGLGPIPIAMIGELFVTEFRASGVGTVLAINNLLLSSVLFSFPLLTETYGISCCMFAYSFAGFAGFSLMFLFLPETKGKTLQEIQKILEM